MSAAKHIHILGGGPAGLAAAYFAHKEGLPFTLYEASDKVGGNSRTFEHNGFRYDSGAHRLHDKDEEISQLFEELLGDDLLKVDAPSAIFYDGKMIDFPLSPLDLMVKLGPAKFARAVAHLLWARFSGSGNSTNFGDHAIHTYGKAIADVFLLDYTEKLWGKPPHQLAPEVSGSRLKGLDLKTFIKEAFAGKRSKTRHLDGGFSYPRLGIGQLSDKLAEMLAPNIKLNSRITAIRHESGRITSIQVNDGETIPVTDVVCTLPVTLTATIWQPAPPDSIMQLAHSLCFRHVMLIAVFLNKPQVTDHATLYFPSNEYSFTRVTEPRNRSEAMSPEGTTSLILEIPTDNPYQDYAELKRNVIKQLIHARLITKDEIRGTSQWILLNAYPILEVGYAEKLQQINRYFNGFSNLHLTGRNAGFTYTHIHDQFRSAKEIITGILRPKV